MNSVIIAIDFTLNFNSEIRVLNGYFLDFSRANIKGGFKKFDLKEYN